MADSVMGKNEKIEINPDKRKVDNILSGDNVEWARFVEKYTDWIFGLAIKLCRKPGATIKKYGELKNIETGEKYIYTEDEQDAYLWIMEELKKKLKFYTGKNGARLSTYIYTLLKSDNLKIDYYRHVYGDNRKIPNILSDTSETEKNVFVLLCREKSLEYIARKVGISREDVEYLEKIIKEKLIKVEQDYKLIPKTKKKCGINRCTKR